MMNVWTPSHVHTEVEPTYAYRYACTYRSGSHTPPHDQRECSSPYAYASGAPNPKYHIHIDTHVHVVGPHPNIHIQVYIHIYIDICIQGGGCGTP